MDVTRTGVIAGPKALPQLTLAALGKIRRDARAHAAQVQAAQQRAQEFSAKLLQAGGTGQSLDVQA